MKSLVLISFYILTLNIILSCGSTKQSDSDIDYRFLHSPFPEAPEYVNDESITKNSLITRALRPITLGVIGRSNTITNEDVKMMVFTWLAPLRNKNSGVTQSVTVTSDLQNADLIVEYTNNAGASCGQTLNQASPRPYIIQVCPDNPYEGLFHEFGHGFGLGDTYDVHQGWGCVRGQPDSVMCSAQSRNLMADDIEGVTALFCKYNSCSSGGGNPSVNPVTSGVDWDQFIRQFKFFGTDKLKCSELRIANLSGSQSVRIRSAPSINAPIVTNLADGTAISIAGAIAGNEQTKVIDSDLAASGKKGSKGELGIEYIWLKLTSPTAGWISKLYAECR